MKNHMKSIKYAYIKKMKFKNTITTGMLGSVVWDTKLLAVVAVPPVVDLVWTGYSEAAHLECFESLRPPQLAAAPSSLLFSENIPQLFPS